MRVWPEAESEAAICRDTAVPTAVLWFPGLVTVTVLPVLPPPTMGCEMAHALVSLDQLACSAKVPVPMVMLAAPPCVPGLIQAHSSEFSWPLKELRVLLVHPPAGFWSDIISCHSWPSVMV